MIEPEDLKDRVEVRIIANTCGSRLEIGDTGFIVEIGKDYEDARIEVEGKENTLAAWHTLEDLEHVNK